jgi:hypothetical protein
MDTVSRTLSVTPDGLLHLFLGANASVELLASAFEADTHVIESSLREAIRKRDAINRAAEPSTWSSSRRSETQLETSVEIPVKRIERRN